MKDLLLKAKTGWLCNAAMHKMNLRNDRLEISTADLDKCFHVKEAEGKLRYIIPPSCKSSKTLNYGGPSGRSRIIEGLLLLHGTPPWVRVFVCQNTGMVPLKWISASSHH